MKNRLQRSELTLPGSFPRFMEKAAASAADVVLLDLEDAVAPDQKEAARRNIIEALNDLDWGSKTVSVRINGLDTEYMYRDVVEVVERCPRLDMLVIPKVGVAADVYAVDVLVTQIERAKRRERRLGFEVLVETALGLTNVEAIAQSGGRLEAITFGAGDYAASLAARVDVIGGVNPDYPGDMWHYPLSRIAAACRAQGLRPVDGPFGDIDDAEGYAAAARRAAALGYEGKWAIHPSQVEIANRIFSPSDKEIEWARRVTEALRRAEREGRGAVTLEGRMIDAASIRMAQRVLEKAEGTR